MVYEGAASPVVFDSAGDLTRATYAVFGYTENGTEQTDTIQVG